jgi:hypothetical protein
MEEGWEGGGTGRRGRRGMGKRVDGEEGMKDTCIVLLGRIHRHLVSVFARGVEPLLHSETHSSNSSIATDNQTDQQELV